MAFNIQAGELPDPNGSGSDPNPGQFTFARTGGDLFESLTIRYTLSGTATPAGEGDSEADYASPPGGAGHGGVYSLTFAANEEQKTLNLTPLNDSTAETSESVILSLRSDEDYRLGSSRAATVTIADNDIDLDIDSDNTGRHDAPDRSEEEETLEDQKAGKLIVVNRDDTDQDDILDFADGFGAFADTSTDSTIPGEQFVPLVLQIPDGLDPAATLEFEYDAANLLDVARTAITEQGLDGVMYTTYNYSVGNGLLRLWRKAGDVGRAAADFITPNQPFSLSDLGLTNKTELTLYLEAVNGSATAVQIKVTLRLPGGATSTDTIRVLPLDPLIGLSENEVEGYNIVRGNGSSLLGGPNNDILIGTDAAELIEGGGGDDIILAGRNNVPVIDNVDDTDVFAGDTINGGAGRDLIFSWFGNNTIIVDDADELSYIEGSRVNSDDASPPPDGGDIMLAAATVDGADALAAQEADAGGQADQPFTSGEIEAAYGWMYGKDDIWLATFKKLGGQVLAVKEDGRNFSNWTIEWKQEQMFGAYTGYDVKIEHDIGSVLTAAAILRQAVMSTARWDARWDGELLDQITDPSVHGDPVENYLTLRKRNFQYAVDVTEIAAELYVNGMTLGFGAVGDVADVVIALPDAVEGDFTAMLAMLPLVPGAVSQLGRARALVDLGFEKFLMKGDILFRDGGKLGFILRYDLVDAAEKVLPKIARIPTPSGKTTWLIGIAQKVVEGGVETTHAATVTRKATELAQSGSYSHITMARNWRTATGRAGGEATSDLVPDIIAVRWDGKVEAFEVASTGDDPADLAARLQQGMNTLPTASRTPISAATNVFPLDP